ncbi:hypothetical protein [Burkholderia pyrrocinia]|uniref:hypothetical protein n=1 Tax=Burkholderia pyrrocinia TaxID=60550 RepID=UPI0030D04113
MVDPSMTVGRLQSLLVPLHLEIVGGASENGVRGGLARSDSFLRFLSGTSGAVMLPI